MDGNGPGDGALTRMRAALCAIALALSAPAGGGPAASAMGQTGHARPKMIFAAETDSAEEFRAFAIRAAALGATHILISDLPKSRWQWDIDRNDPYPNWGMLQASIFKVVVPPELARWIPADYARRNLEIVRTRGAILRSLGLKAAFKGIEPAWLPEGVYEAHPEWRGPRCDQPVRSRHAYYAICVDRPEVLGMYRRAVAELCRAAPIDTFDFLTNDSGGGFCWSASLYPGINGPSWCEGRSMAERVTGFFSAIQEGAADDGIPAEVGAHYGAGVVSRAEVDSVIAGLRPGQSLNGRTREGASSSIEIGPNPIYNQTYPVVGVPQLEQFAEQLEESRARPVSQVFVYLQPEETPWTYELIRRFNAHPTKGLKDRIELIRAVAADYVGESNADELVDAFHRTSLAVDALGRVGLGPVLCLGVVNQRWINRPFVPFPRALTEAERSYYRPFQFQANSEAEAADLMNLQGGRPFGGYSGALWARVGLDHVIGSLRAAAGGFETVGHRITDPAKRDALQTTAARLRAFACLCRTAENAAQYQAILDRTDTGHSVKQSTAYPLAGDQRLLDLQTVTRDEIDNVNELIGLLESAKHPLLQLAATPAEEDVFTLGPTLVSQLRLKVKIMLAHQLDANRLYQRRQS